MIDILFFARTFREEVWEYDFIMKEILPKDVEKSIHYRSLDQIRESDETFDVFVYSCREPSNYFWGYMPTYEDALECVLKTKPKIIIQLSDEYAHEDLAIHNELAQHCKLFLRQHNHQEIRNKQFGTPIYEYDNLIHMPLGYLNDTPVEKARILPPEERKYNWSFVGKIENKDWQFCFYDYDKQEWVSSCDRGEMMDVFTSSVPNYFFQEQGISKEELIELYSDSIFVPCGRGNTSMNCFRHYECTVCGAIPVSVYHYPEEIDIIFKYDADPVPWIFASSWKEAAEKCNQLLQEPEKLKELQVKNLNWWNQVMSNIRSRVESVL